jgi:hypothetical protein
VLEMICVTFSTGIEPLRRGSQTMPPLSCTTRDN